MPDKNPYQDDDVDEDDELPAPPGAYNGSSDSSMSRNGSNTSLRSRSTTGDSGPPPMPNGVRIPPPRFPMGFQPPPLTLHTQVPNHVPSPGEHPGASYFSPTLESPMSSRTSSSSGMYPFPRQATPNNGWPDEHNRFTAPAIGRSMSREPHPGANGYQMNGRTILRPSLPAMAPQSLQQAALAQNRSRSASSPDIHNRLMQAHRAANGNTSQPPVPDVPVPPVPPHIAHMKAPVNRSLNNSPTNHPHGSLPVRSATQSPGLYRDRTAQNHHQGPGAPENMSRHDPRALLPSPNTTPVPLSAVEARPPTSMPPSEGIPTPTQLKVKVSFDNNYVTLVVGMNITYQSLVDRIDAKLSRFTTSSIGRGTIRLRYKDEDGDFVTIRSDEDIHIAFSDWKEQQRSQLLQGQLGEIQLYCQGLE